MFETLDERDYVEFLAAVWEHRGWETEVQPEEDSTFMIAGDRPDGGRALMLVDPSTEATVDVDRVGELARICDAKNVDLGVVATRGDVTEDAERRAADDDLHVLDTETLEATVESEGLEDLLETVEDGGGIGAVLPSDLPFPTPSVSPPTIPTRGIAALLVIVGVAAAAVVGLQTAGVLGAGALDLPVGLESDDGLTATAVSLTGGEGEGVHVAWTANRRSTLPGPNGTTYRPPAGDTFVVVTMAVSNDRGATTRLQASTFAFAANGTVHGPHRLAGASGQLPVTLDPGRTNTTWVAFTVDAEAERGTLLALPNGGSVPVRFEHRPRLAGAFAS
ncbi:MAG: restriction endonuclease [Halanaeroarchaeum sp.]